MPKIGKFFGDMSKKLGESFNKFKDDIFQELKKHSPAYKKKKKKKKRKMVIF